MVFGGKTFTLATLYCCKNKTYTEESVQEHGQSLSSDVYQAVAAWEIKQWRAGFIEGGRKAAGLFMNVRR